MRNISVNQEPSLGAVGDNLRVPRGGRRWGAELGAAARLLFSSLPFPAGRASTATTLGPSRRLQSTHPTHPDPGHLLLRAACSRTLTAGLPVLPQPVCKNLSFIKCRGLSRASGFEQPLPVNRCVGGEGDGKRI